MANVRSPITEAYLASVPVSASLGFARFCNHLHILAASLEQNLSVLQLTLQTALQCLAHLLNKVSDRDALYTTDNIPLGSVWSRVSIWADRRVDI